MHRDGRRARRSALRGFGGLVVGASMALSVLAAPAASAAPAIRYASPSGSGTACTKGAPCRLAVAIEKAPTGAVVRVLGNQGPFVQVNPIEAKRISIVGINGRPSIVFSGVGLTLTRSTATNLSIEGTGDGVALTLREQSSASRMVAHATGTSHACALLSDSTLKNVLCWADGFADKAVEVKGDATLRNVTAYGGTEAGLRVVGYDICGCDRFTVTLVNTIVWAPLSTDLSITTDLPDVTIKPTYSNYRTVDAVEEGADIRVIKSATNQTKVGVRPDFIDVGGGNFRALAGSPVIGKGVDAAANGAKDLDGRPREVGGRTDIGAYEFSPPTTTITGGPKGTVSGSPAAFTFKASRAGATFQCRIDTSPNWLVCTTPYAPGWVAGPHTFRVRAVDGLGYVDPSPATRTFTVTGG